MPVEKYASMLIGKLLHTNSKHLYKQSKYNRYEKEIRLNNLSEDKKMTPQEMKNLKGGSF